MSVGLLDNFYTNPATIAASTSSLMDILERSHINKIPFGSIQAWRNIQEQSKICRRFMDLKRTGQLPGKKERDRALLNKMIKNCSINDDLIVSSGFDSNYMMDVHKTFVPPEFIYSILTVMHMKLNHPTISQLGRIFHKYFSGFNSAKICKELTETCSLCESIKRFPVELEVRPV